VLDAGLAVAVGPRLVIGGAVDDDPVALVQLGDMLSECPQQVASKKTAGVSS
jgi:hypothetical protein